MEANKDDTVVEVELLVVTPRQDTNGETTHNELNTRITPSGDRNSGYTSDGEKPTIEELRNRIYIPQLRSDLPQPKDKFSQFVDQMQLRAARTWMKHVVCVKRVFNCILFIMFLVFLGFAIKRNIKDAALVVGLTSVIVLYMLYTRIIKKRCASCVIPLCQEEYWIKHKRIKKIATW